MLYPLLLLLASHPRRRCGAVSAMPVFALCMGFVVMGMLFGLSAQAAAGLIVVLVAVTVSLTATGR